MVSAPLVAQQQQEWYPHDEDDAAPKKVCQLNVTRLGRFFRKTPKIQHEGDTPSPTRFKGLLLPPQWSSRRSTNARLATTICAVRVRDERRKAPEQRGLLKRYQLSQLTKIHDDDDDDDDNNNEENYDDSDDGDDDETRDPPPSQEQDQRPAELPPSPNKRPDSFASSPKDVPETNVWPSSQNNVHSEDRLSNRSPQSRHSSKKSSRIKCEPAHSPMNRVPVHNTQVHTTPLDYKESEFFYGFDPYGSSFETEDPDNICDHPITNDEVRLRRKQERMRAFWSQESFVEDGEELEFTSAEDNTESSRRKSKRFEPGDLRAAAASEDIPSQLSFANEWRVGTYLMTTDPRFPRALSTESENTLSMVADDVSLEYSFVEPLRDDCCVFF